MVNVLGDSTGEEGVGNLQLLRKVIAISGKYADYINEIHASHKLGYPAPECSPTLVFTCENKVFSFGALRQHLYEITPKAITKTHYLTYGKEGSNSSGGNAASIKGDRGIRGKRGVTGEAGPIGPHCPKGVRGDIAPSGEAGVTGDRVVLDRLDRKEKDV